MAIDTSLDHAIDVVNGLSTDDLHRLVSYANQIYDMEAFTTIERLSAKVQELEGLVAKAYYSESLVREYKVEGFDEFIESQKTPEGRYPMLIKLKVLIDWKNKLESKDE